MTARARHPDALPGAIEALLFLSGEPVSARALASALDVPPDAVERGLERLESRLTDRGSGLRILRAAGGVQLVTAAEHAAAVTTFLQAGMREQLTPAAAETLAIVAYRGPVSRAAIEAVRGVNSTFTLRLLTMRGLLERSPSEADSRAYLYEVSGEFLRHLGLTRVEDLPDYAALHAHEGMRQLARAAESPPAHDR